MAYYYALDDSRYFLRWSVGAAFSECSVLPDSVEVPEPLQSCACNVRAYQYKNGVITYDPGRENCTDDGNIEAYNGSYEITPQIVQQVMYTQNKYMSKDVNIKAIPYYDVSNSMGGSTVYIGTMDE